MRGHSLNQLKHGHWGQWENSFFDGVEPQKSPRSPGYRHRNAPKEIGQPEAYGTAPYIFIYRDIVFSEILSVMA